VSHLYLANVFAPGLLGASLELDAGLHVVVGNREDGGAALVALVAGLLRPKRGTLLIDGGDPLRSPELRGRVGVLLAEEPPSSGRSVLAQVAEALSLRGDPAKAENVLSAAGLDALASRRPNALSSAERRALALALATSLAQPSALALHEPLANIAHCQRRKIIETLNALAARGAVVLCVTASPRDAAALGGSTVLLDRGRFVRRPGLPLAEELTPGAGLTLSLRTSDPRKLAAALSAEPAVSAVVLDEQAHPGQLRASGADPERLALAVASAAQRSATLLSAIEPLLPSIDDARAATAGLWRAAYENAYRAARVPAAPAPPRAPAAPPSPPTEDGGAQ
jgi:ABC-type thiamine transport system ATPase subunit